jgi:hypothetical protein
LTNTTFKNFADILEQHSLVKMKSGEEKRNNKLLHPKFFEPGLYTLSGIYRLLSPQPPRPTADGPWMPRTAHFHSLASRGKMASIAAGFFLRKNAGNVGNLLTKTLPQVLK